MTRWLKRWRRRLASDRIAVRKTGPASVPVEVRLLSVPGPWLSVPWVETNRTHMSNTTSTPPKHLADLHFEHLTWTRQFEFYKSELHFFKKMLEEVAQRNTDNDILREVEKFQNQFTVQRDVIDRFLHSIHLHADALEKDVTVNPVASDHRLHHDHAAEREQFETFERLFADLRKDFMEHLRRWM